MLTLGEFSTLTPREQGRWMARNSTIAYNPYPANWPERREFNIGYLLGVLEAK